MLAGRTMIITRVQAQRAREHIAKVVDVTTNILNLRRHLVVRRIVHTTQPVACDVECPVEVAATEC